jgi:hypothetical protein
MKRVFKKIPDELLPYYANPIESLDSWVHSLSKETATLKLLGTNSYQKGKNAIKEQGVFSYDAALANTSGSDFGRAIGGIADDATRDEIRGLVALRVGRKMATPGDLVRSYKALVNVSLLANPLSALVQLGDIPIAAYKYGLSDAAFGLSKSLLPRGMSRKVTKHEMGLDRMYQEFEDIADHGWLDRLQDSMFKVSGFTTADRIGKETILNAALRRGSRAVEDPKRFKQMSLKYSHSWGNDFDGLMQDFVDYNAKGKKKEDITDRMKSYLFTELSGVQPISPLEQTQWSAESSAGKAFWTLKSFMLKQMDVMRNDMLQEARRAYKTGDIAAGAKAITNLTKFVGTVGLGNFAIQEVREVIKGEKDFSDIMKGDDGDMLTAIVFGSLESTGGLINMDEYFLSKMAETDKPLETVVTSVLPPLGVGTVKGMLGAEDVEEATDIAREGIPTISNIERTAEFIKDKL